MSQIKSFRDMKVNQKLKGLHLEVSELSLAFPKFELYELGSQIRRSFNAAAAILAEGWGSRHQAGGNDDWQAAGEITIHVMNEFP